MKFDAILFDCDGVLVDGEPIVNTVLRDMLAERGWAMTLEVCMQTFVGKAVRDEHLTIEAHTGQPMPPEWLHGFYARRNLALTQQLEIMAGAHVAVQAAQDHTLQRIACASGADRFKVEMQCGRIAPTRSTVRPCGRWGSAVCLPTWPICRNYWPSAEPLEPALPVQQAPCWKPRRIRAGRAC